MTNDIPVASYGSTKKINGKTSMDYDGTLDNGKANLLHRLKRTISNS